MRKYKTGDKCKVIKNLLDPDCVGHIVTIKDVAFEKDDRVIYNCFIKGHEHINCLAAETCLEPVSSLSPESYVRIEKVRKRNEAAVIIALIIEEEYGGMITPEEWKMNETQADFSGIYYFPKTGYDIRVPLTYHFLTFRSRELAEKFLSSESNVKLLDAYHMQ